MPFNSVHTPFRRHRHLVPRLRSWPCASPLPKKKTFAVTGARFMGGNLISVSDPPFEIFRTISFHKVHVSVDFT